MSFLKKTTTLGTPATTPKLGATLGAKKLGGGLKAQPKEIEIEPTTTAKTIPAAGSKKLGTKKLGSGLKTKKPTLVHDDSTIINEAIEAKKEEVKEELTFEPAEKPKTTTKKLGTKKLGSKKAEPKEVEIEPTPEQVVEKQPEPAMTVSEEGNITINAETIEIKTEEPKEEVKEEKKEEKKTTKKKTTSRKKSAKKEEVNEITVVAELEVDETKRVTLEEMDTIMRPIVAPTTELWEQEKKDVLEALNNVKVEQDMTMAQVKSCLADLDELNFEILPKLHDAETMYDGTKQNYDTVKAVAIAKGSATNSEGRKAEGIIACQNFVTPSGAVVDLHQYMLLIEERNKFYQKINEGINFKKYSLVNYNNALKIESKEL